MTASNDHTARVMRIDADNLTFSDVTRISDEVLEEGSPFAAMSLHHDPKHRRLYVGSADATIRVWHSELGIELGKAGELRVASEMILRGHRPSIFLIDTGLDIITEEGIKIQVKTARLNTPDINECRSPSYAFNFRRWDRNGSHNLEGIDFIICWGIDTDQFWIFPTSQFEKCITLKITPTGEYRKKKTKG